MSTSSKTDELPPAERPYIHEMVVVHRVFRRESALLPRLVRAVPDGGTARAKQVAEHLRAYVGGLHHHHALEDELVWPLLHARAAQDDALVSRMEAQHHRIDESLLVVADWTPAWERTADRIAGEELALALDAHRTALLEHLDDEERLALPLVAENLTVAEWDLVGTRGLEEVPRNQIFIALGALLEEATAEESAHFLGKAPLIGRLLWKVVGRRQYAAARRAIRGPLDGGPDA
ncbi:hemerythrin domain-containing protein [Streptomyces brasiliscabiei]|uniref:hemerythrin domain-containing protein n=1 Tax=Streptomyces brasiliscabiei TaxID=2736302 RepID=UPI0027DF8617|nr:hemerythrin domain-containing protein [Streptomyces brasiliscabiei]